MFGMIENDLWFVFLFQSLLGDLVRRSDELAQHRLAANHLRVMCDVRGVRQPISKVRDEADAANRFECVLFLKFFADQDWVNLGAALKERRHRDEHSPVWRYVIILGPQQLHCLADETVVENYAAKDSALSLGAVWQRTLKRLLAYGIGASHVWEVLFRKMEPRRKLG